MVTSFENMTVSLLLDDCLRCTPSVRPSHAPATNFGGIPSPRPLIVSGDTR